MGLAVGLLILVALSIPLVVAISRANELFCLDVVRGKATFVRGRAPKRLLDEIDDVVKRPAIARARIRVVSEDGHPRVLVSSGQIPDGQLQQLRNVVGSFRVAEIRAGARPR